MFLLQTSTPAKVQLRQTTLELRRQYRKCRDAGGERKILNELEAFVFYEKKGK